MQIMQPVDTDKDGAERHPSWVVLNASRVQSGSGTNLFDSEIAHRHYVIMKIRSCSRRRSLKNDWIHGENTLMELHMSLAQWGGFVSSFGDGGGVPATLAYDKDGAVASAPFTSRLEKSIQEVHDSGDEALTNIRDSYEELADAFEAGAGKKALRELLFSLKCQIDNGPKNMKFTAESLAEAAENVVAKARADIEAMATGADSTSLLGAGSGAPALERSVKQRPTRKRGV